MRSRFFSGTMLVCAVALLSACPKRQAEDAGKSANFVADDPLEAIQAVYHGLPLDADGKLVGLSRESIENSLRKFVKTHSDKSKDSEAIEQFKAKLREKGQLDPSLELLITGAQAEYIALTNPELAAGEMPAKLAFLREQLKVIKLDEVKWAGDRGPEAVQSMQKEFQLQINRKFWEMFRPWWPWEPFKPIKFRYCALSDVPQPPDWGTAGWVRKTSGAVNTVPANRLYILNTPGYSTEVWTHTDPGGRGGCIALPRKDGGLTTQGVICQNSNSGNACFWDNRPHPGGATFSDAEMLGAKKSIVKDWVNGNDPALSGGGKCVQCHRGENAFVLHQDTLLSNNPAMPFNTDSSVWYKMINSLGWTNPPKTTFATGGGCTSCHEIGSTTDGEKANYCSILKKASNAEMPSVAAPVGWNPAAGSPYKAHIDAMKANGCPP